MTGRHTPGPWRLGSLISYNGSTGEPEAFVYRLPQDHPEETAHNRLCVRGSASMDCDADARLISAAPDLLDAVKQLKGLAEREGWRHVAIQAADAAIAKAEGRS